MAGLGNLTALSEQCSETERKDAYRACWIVALADGQLDGERDQLNEIARQLRLDDDAAHQIETDVRGGNRKCSTPKNEAARQLISQCAIGVAKADGRLARREKEIVRRLGKHLGISSDEVESQLADAGEARTESRSVSRPTRPVTSTTEESSAESLGGLLGSLRPQRERQRRYRYSSPFGWLPGAHAVFFIGFGLSIFVWMVGGPSGYEWLGILPPFWLISGTIIDSTIFLRRSFSMRSATRDAVFAKDQLSVGAAAAQ